MIKEIETVGQEAATVTGKVHANTQVTSYYTTAIVPSAIPIQAPIGLCHVLFLAEISIL